MSCRQPWNKTGGHRNRLGTLATGAAGLRYTKKFHVGNLNRLSVSKQFGWIRGEGAGSLQFFQNLFCTFAKKISLCCAVIGQHNVAAGDCDLVERLFIVLQHGAWSGPRRNAEWKWQGIFWVPCD